MHPLSSTCLSVCQSVFIVFHLTKKKGASGYKPEGGYFSFAAKKGLVRMHVVVDLLPNSADATETTVVRNCY